MTWAGHFERWWPAYLGVAGFAGYLWLSDDEVAGEIIEVVKKVTGNSSLAYHNPGNLRPEYPDKWTYDGEDGTWVSSLSGEFLKFKNDFYGIRAMTVNALNYQLKHDIATLYDLGLRWAPPKNNAGDTKYGIALGKILGVDPYGYFSIIENISNLVPAIIRKEQGYQPFSQAVLTQAIGAGYASKQMEIDNYA